MRLQLLDEDLWHFLCHARVMVDLSTVMTEAGCDTAIFRALFGLPS